MNEAIERLRTAIRPTSTRVTVRADDLREVLNLISNHLTSAELKMVDKHCDWVAFKHAFNCVVKSRLGGGMT